MRIEVDPIKCEAHGLCAELLPERITLDEWGYPIIDPTPIPPALDGLARRTIDACPTLALRLSAAEAGSERSAEERRAVAELGQNPTTGQPPYQVYRQRRGRR